jgi:16S rRNA U516 pseudouridylate synthase RsuA-like enzyme
MSRSRQVGLARALSKLGYCSRSEAAGLIRTGRVRLNGAVARDPETPVRLERARIEVDGQLLAIAAKIYLMLNKPRGVVTTASDEKGRQTVYGFLDDALPWVSPVGRLDKASEGLLLLTNDSEWAAQVTAPETHLDKTYHAQIDKVADGKLLQSIEKGIKAISCASKVFESYVEATAIPGSRLFWTKARTVTFDECLFPSALPCCDWCGSRLAHCLSVNWPKGKFEV